MGSFSIWHWLIVLLIVPWASATLSLTDRGGDLGGAVKGFKDGMKDGSASADDKPAAAAGQVSNGAVASEKTTIDVEAKQKS